MDIKEEINNLIENNSDYVWKNLGTYKAEVREKYIRQLQQEEPQKDAQQSWRSASGKFLEIFVQTYLQKNMSLSASRESQISASLKDELKIEFSGEEKLPDLDIVLHDKDQPVAVVSCKTSLRERVSQTLFWANKFEDSNIAFCFVTTDTDDELAHGRKWRPILEEDIERTYLCEDNPEKFSDSIRPFNEIIRDF